MGFYSVAPDSDGYAFGNSARGDCDFSVSRRVIVLADRDYSFRECIKAETIDGAGAFGGVDRDLRVARVGLRARSDLGLGAGWALGVGVRKHRTLNVEGWIGEAAEQVLDNPIAQPIERRRCYRLQAQ